MITDPDDLDTVFDLLTVTLAEEEMAARPTEFTYDDNEDVTGVVKYETTCGRCSQLVQFGPEQVQEDDEGKLYVQGCKDCPIQVAATPKIEGADFDSILIDDAFEDPIVSGAMVVEGATRLNI